MRRSTCTMARQSMTRRLETSASALFSAICACGDREADDIRPGAAASNITICRDPLDRGAMRAGTIQILVDRIGYREERPIQMRVKTEEAAN